MKLLLTIELPGQPDWRLPADWAGELLRGLGQTILLEKPAGRPAGCEVSLTLTDDEQIWRLNRQFRSVDRPTDVLSFPQYQPGEKILPHTSLGDIVISLPRLAAQAAAYGHSQKRELLFLFVHGLLHLLGYDHEISAEEEKRQFARQEQVLALLGVNR